MPGVAENEGGEGEIIQAIMGGGQSFIVSEQVTEACSPSKVRSIKAVDLSKTETRRTLSPTALRGFFNIAREWRLDDDQMRGLLGGIAPSTLHSWRRSAAKRVLGRDTMTRISLVVGIYKALHTCFRDPGDYWITNPNNSPLFGGAVPIDYMIHTGVIGMYEIRKMLDAWARGC